MKHNLKTLRETIDSYPCEDAIVLDELDKLIEELQQLDLEKWCVEHGFGKLQAVVLCKFVEDEILGLGGSNPTRQEGDIPTKEAEE